MLNSKSSIGSRFAKKGSRRSGIISALSLVFLVASTSTWAEAPTEQYFPTAAAAAKTLVEAARTDNMTALAAILGIHSRDILYSGDPVVDNNARDNFVAKYDQMHRLAYDADGDVILYIGADNWPFAIPLVKENKGWRFDSEAGEEELLSRRVGSNELYTIDVLADLAKAQHEYADEMSSGSGIKEFALKVRSDPGKRNGLYWPISDGQEESPIGPLIADAVKQGYNSRAGSLIPFHGYYYKVLTRQGKNAPGGALDYMDQGKMTKGFAFLAYPATYRASGVMTFMINQEGVIVQKDLGPNTARVAAAITEYNPDQSWDEVGD